MYPLLDASGFALWGAGIDPTTHAPAQKEKGRPAAYFFGSKRGEAAGAR